MSSTMWVLLLLLVCVLVEAQLPSGVVRDRGVVKETKVLTDDTSSSSSSSSSATEEATGGPMLKEWQVFKTKYKKSYSSPKEEQERYVHYCKNMAAIATHNEGYNSGLSSYHLRSNQFTDMTLQEFQQYTTVTLPIEGILPGNCEKWITNCVDHRKQMQAEHHKGDKKHKCVNWQKEGYITPVKDQGKCGSCYAFTTVAAMECALMIERGVKCKEARLSEMELVNCDKGSYGCEGGIMGTNYEYIQKKGGLSIEESYPYKPKDGRCELQDKCCRSPNITYRILERFDENTIRYKVEEVCVAVGVNAQGHCWMFYGGGVLYDLSCCPVALTHALIIVGHCYDEDGLPYWCLKNSWGDDWGEKGYVKLYRGCDMCGVAIYTSYVNIKDEKPKHCKKRWKKCDSSSSSSSSSSSESTRKKDCKCSRENCC